MTQSCELISRNGGRGPAPSELERSRALQAQYGALSGFVRSRLPPELRRFVDPEDILQETFIDAWRYGATSRRAHSASVSIVWLRTVAKRKIVDWLRRNKTKKRASDNVEPCSLEQQRESFHLLPPGFELEQREQRRILLDAVEQLSPRYRTVVRLRFFEQLPFVSVACELGISPKAAQMVVKRATVRLKRIIGHRTREFY